MFRNMAIVYEEEKGYELVDKNDLKRANDRLKHTITGYQKRYNAAHKNEIRAYLREYYKQNKDKYKPKPRQVKTSVEEDERTDRLFDSQQLRKLKKSLKTSLSNPERARVNQNQLKQILIEEEIRRANEYLNPVNMKKLLCIVGESGVGKTLVSLHLKNYCDANVICSFTTRPPRETEVEGRDHHFIDVVPPDEELLAYADFGPYKYYALKSQVFGPCTVYVVDEKGLIDLLERHKDEYRIFSVYITRDRKLRLKHGVSSQRMDRDKTRKRLDLEFFDYVIENNGTKRELFNNIERIFKEVKEK